MTNSTSITIGFSKRRKPNLLSNLISKIEGTEASHAYIKYYSESIDRTLIYQANGHGVFFTGNTQFDSVSVIVKEYEFTISPEQRKKSLQFAIDNSGKSYGFLTIAGFTAVRFVRWAFGKNITNPFADEGHTYFCTELVAAVLESAGFPHTTYKDTIGLKDLQDIVELLHEDLPNG